MCCLLREKKLAQLLLAALFLASVLHDLNFFLADAYIFLLSILATNFLDFYGIMVRLLHVLAVGLLHVYILLLVFREPFNRFVLVLVVVHLNLAE